VTVFDSAIEKLKARYRRQVPIAKTDWPKHCVTDFVKLAVVEKGDEDIYEHMNTITRLQLCGELNKVMSNRKPLDDLSEIFHYQGRPCPRLILIMGAPGMAVC